MYPSHRTGPSAAGRSRTTPESRDAFLLHARLAPLCTLNTEVAGEGLDVDAVELIEAAPGSRKSQTSGVQLAAAKRRPGMPDMAFEELSHHDVVHLWRAIEHHALLRQCLLLLSIT